MQNKLPSLVVHLLQPDSTLWGEDIAWHVPNIILCMNGC